MRPDDRLFRRALLAAVLLHAAGGAFAAVTRLDPFPAPAARDEESIRVALLEMEAPGELVVGEESPAPATRSDPVAAPSAPRATEPVSTHVPAPEPTPASAPELTTEPTPAIESVSARATAIAISSAPAISAPIGTSIARAPVAAMGTAEPGGDELRRIYGDYRDRLGTLLGEAMERRYERESERRGEGVILFRVEVRSDRSVRVLEVTGASPQFERIAREALATAAAPPLPSALPEPVSFRFRTAFRLRNS